MSVNQFGSEHHVSDQSTLLTVCKSDTISLFLLLWRLHLNLIWKKKSFNIISCTEDKTNHADEEQK